MRSTGSRFRLELHGSCLYICHWLMADTHVEHAALLGVPEIVRHFRLLRYLTPAPHRGGVCQGT
jgi:hypothetical protein